jgi:hypothetical protein
VSENRGWVTYVRDTILFVLGIVIILKQAGLWFPPPEGGPALELLFIGALFCNGPLFLSYLTARRGGIPGSSVQEVPSAPELPSGRSSPASSGGE